MWVGGVVYGRKGCGGVSGWRVNGYRWVCIWERGMPPPFPALPHHRHQQTPPPAMPQSTPPPRTQPKGKTHRDTGVDEVEGLGDGGVDGLGQRARLVRELRDGLEGLLVGLGHGGGGGGANDGTGHCCEVGVGWWG